MSRPRLRVLTAAAVCSIAAFVAPGCGDKVTEENFDKITLGMGLDQVQDFMGEGEREDVSGVTISGAGIAGGSPAAPSTKTFSWKSGDKQIIIETKAEKVIAKRKLGF